MFGSGGNKNPVLRIGFVLAGAALLCGCTKSKLDKLLTLKGLADEQVAMSEAIETQDRNFEKMLEEYHAGTLKQYSTQSKVARAFGDPIYVKEFPDDTAETEKWMYRYAGRFFGSEKIYLYFDAQDNLVRTEYEEADHGEVRQEAQKED